MFCHVLSCYVMLRDHVMSAWVVSGFATWPCPTFENSFGALIIGLFVGHPPNIPLLIPFGSGFFHTCAHTHTLLHTNAFTRRSFYAQTLLHVDFTHRHFYSQNSLDIDSFTYRSFLHTQTLLLHMGHLTGPTNFAKNFSVFSDRTSFRAKGLHFVGRRWHGLRPKEREEKKEIETERKRERERGREREDVKM